MTGKRVFWVGCIGIVVLFTVGSQALQAQPSPEVKPTSRPEPGAGMEGADYLAMIEARLTVFHDAAVDAGLDEKEKAILEAIVRKHLALADEHLRPRADGTASPYHPIDVILAVESNVQRDLMADPAIGPRVTKLMALNEVVRLIVRIYPGAMWGLLGPANLPEAKRTELDEEAKRVHDAALIMQKRLAAEKENAKAMEAVDELMATHRTFRRKLYESMSEDQRNAVIESLSQGPALGTIEMLSYLDQQPATRRGDRPPADAIASIYTLGAVEAPADGEYELVSLENDQPIHRVRLKKGDYVGFAWSETFNRFEGRVKDDQIIDLDDYDRTHYWRLAKP